MSRATPEDRPHGPFALARKKRHQTQRFSRPLEMRPLSVVPIITSPAVKVNDGFFNPRFRWTFPVVKQVDGDFRFFCLVLIIYQNSDLCQTHKFASWFHPPTFEVPW